MNAFTVVTVVFAATAAASLRAQWGPVTVNAPPDARSEHLLAFDAIGNRTLMFGGEFTNSFWSHSGGQWTQLVPATLPGPRARANMAANLFTGEVLLYGGQDGANSFALDETWRWDGTTWQQLAPALQPGGRIRHGMAFDVGRQAYVVFGGYFNLFNFWAPIGETWEFANGTWANVSPPIGPPALISPAMAYHPVLGGVMLFGGQAGGTIVTPGVVSDETWTFDGVSWTQIGATGPKPSPRIAAQMVTDFARSVCVLTGGFDPITMEICNDTWEHDGVAWREVTGVHGGIHPPRRDFAMAYDMLRGRIVAFGGRIANGSLRNDTWEFGAHFQPFGIGCAGSAGTPGLVGAGLPHVGATALIDITNVPPAMPFAVLSAGLSRTQWALGSLPALLTPFGMPGCRNYTSADLLTVVPAVNGTASWSWIVPPQASFVGTELYVQGITLDPGINALGLAMSRAATLVIGH